MEHWGIHGKGVLIGLLHQVVAKATKLRGLACSGAWLDVRSGMCVVLPFCIVPLLLVLPLYRAARGSELARMGHCGRPRSAALDLRRNSMVSPADASTVVLADPDDPYYPLAEEIARHETLPLASSLDEVWALNPVFLLWVVSPSGLSDPVLANFGLAIRDRGAAISVGIISGGTLEKARDLWRREFAFSGRHLTVVAREGRIRALVGDRVSEQPLTKDNLVAAIRRADYLIFHGHGARRYLRLDEDLLLVADDVPPLPPLVVSTAACQTFRIWDEESIALSFTDRGAAAYVGFVHSPTGYLVGEPDGYPFRHTWPGFPIGHVVLLQNRGLMQGFLHWPFYLQLGDPRLSFQGEEPYQLVSDSEEGDTRIMNYTDAPQGVIPVRIPGGARYSFVEIPTVTAAWEGDPFYNGALQMADIGDDKYLLFVHKGGEFSVRLHPRPPWTWVILEPLVDALDEMVVLHHSSGGVVPNLLVAVLPLIVVGWLFLRGKVSARTGLPAVATGLGLAGLRGIYALVRRDHMTLVQRGLIRTVDGSFQISPLFLLSAFLLAGCGALLYLNTRSRWGKGLAVLTVTFPNWAIAGMWFGLPLFMNLYARRRIGAPLYGYGRCLMALIAFASECLVVLLGLAVLGRWASRSDKHGRSHPR